MGNAFGNYPTADHAKAAILDMGFKPSSTTDGVYWQRAVTTGNMFEAPRSTIAQCRVVECKVAPQYGGKSYYQIEYI